MTSEAILQRQRLIMAIGVVISLILPVVAWAMVPVGGVSLEEARAVLFEATRARSLDVLSIDDAPHRSLPVWVEWHPVRLLDQREALLGPTQVETAAWRYRFATPDGLEVDCELHSRDGEVLWIRLDGPEETAAVVKPLRTELRLALPWLPVSAPWQ